MATIITKNSQTASAVPSAASLSVGELAVNTADGKLYTEHTGGVVKEIIPSTVVDGGITANKLASNAVVEAKIADGAVTTNKLSNSGVTAGTYTTATVTVDAKGRITSAASGSGGGVTSLNGQTGAVVTTNIDSIGSTMTLYLALNTPYATTSGAVTIYGHGNTQAGSSLRYGVDYRNSGRNIAGQSAVPWGSGGTALSGTWRSMGGRTYMQANFDPCQGRSYGYWEADIWVRIS